MQPQVGFVLDIPADPSWEPFDTTDVLDQDGYYQAKITKESGRNDPGKSQGIFLTMEIQDADARGKILSRFLPDPRTAKGNVWFVWRGLLRSITGTLDGARQGLRYQPGMFTGQLVYIKTERSQRDDRVSTDIDSWVTGPSGKRLCSRTGTAGRRSRCRRVATSARCPVACLEASPVCRELVPLRLCSSGRGCPVRRAPRCRSHSRQPATTPQPGGAPFAAPPPVQQTYAPSVQQQQPQQTFAPPPQQQFAPPPGQFPMGAPATAPAPVAAPVDPAAPPAPGQPFSFAPFPGMGAPPPVNGAPQPTTAAGIVSSFPPPQR